MRHWIWLGPMGCLALAGCTVDLGSGEQVDASAPADPDAGAALGDAAAAQPDAGPAGISLGTYKLTYYWIADEAAYPGVPDTEVYDSECTVLATVTRDFFDAMRLEGTARLIDDRVVNYWGACGCANSPCFSEVDAEHPWGSGSMNRALQPFRSVAIDRAVLSIGDSLYAPELDGAVVPGDAPWGDFVHDGCLVADDTGGSIDGMHIDFFVAVRSAYRDLNGQLGLANVELYDGGQRCAAD